MTLRKTFAVGVGILAMGMWLNNRAPDQASYHAASPLPGSVAWSPNFDQVTAVANCDMATQRLLHERRTPSAPGRMAHGPDPGSGQVDIFREFSAQNGFGAQISQRYACTVDAATNSVISTVIIP